MTHCFSLQNDLDYRLIVRLPPRKCTRRRYSREQGRKNNEKKKNRISVELILQDIHLKPAVTLHFELLRQGMSRSSRPYYRRRWRILCATTTSSPPSDATAHAPAAVGVVRMGMCVSPGVCECRDVVLACVIVC